MNQLISFDQPAAADIAYINGHWAVLAAEAWRGYVRSGRGSIVIDRTHYQEPSISYYTQIAACCSGWLSVETAAQIRLYDPRRELICVVVYDAVTIMTYRVSVAAPTPPDAYAQLCLQPHAPSA